MDTATDTPTVTTDDALVIDLSQAWDFGYAPRKLRKESDATYDPATKTWTVSLRRSGKAGLDYWTRVAGADAVEIIEGGAR